MVFGVVVLHTPMYVDLALLAPGAFEWTKAYFQHALFRSSVPVLSLISGFLLFSSNLDLTPKKLWAKKARTLLLPFLVFNLSALIAVYVVQTKTGITATYNLPNASFATWMNAAFGLTHSPINFPLNFLRELIVLMVLAPLFGIVIRRAPIIGFFAVSGIFLFDLDGPVILRATMAILFYVGGVAAVYRWDLTKLDRFAFPLLVTFLLICACVITFRVTDRTYFRLLSPLLLWPAAALLVDTRVGIWMRRASKYSLFIFVAHAPILTMTWLAYQKVRHAVPYPVYWVIAPLFTAALLIGLYRFAMQFAPRSFGRIIGVDKPSSVPVKLAVA